MAFSVAIEGIDGSGKGTQATKLHESLSQTGLSTTLISFPRYEKTSFGKRVADFLNGKFGTLSEVPPELVSLLYAGDRLESLSFIQDAFANHDVVVFDRYVPSNIAHQGAKLSADDANDFVQWIQHVEYDIYKIPKPDQIILLDVPSQFAQENVLKKQARDYTDQKTDIQEANRDYLEAVRQFYLQLAGQSENWNVIAGCNTENKQRTIEEIASEIETVVRRKM